MEPYSNSDQPGGSRLLAVPRKQVIDYYFSMNAAWACRLAELKRWNERLMRKAGLPQIRSFHQAYTDAAGVIFSPSYAYQGEVFWCRDRLDFLEEAMTES